MSKFYLSVVLFFSFNFSFSAPVIKSVSNGDWSSTSTWNLNRLPQDGDTIVINSLNVVTVNDHENFSAATFLKIYGQLAFQNNSSSLSLSNGSFIWVFPGALVMGGGSASQKLRLNGVVVFSGNDAPVYGPMMASTASSGFAAMMNATFIALPVKFVGFSVTEKGKDALIQWSASEELNANSYEIQRSLDGNTWTTIAEVLANSNGSATSNYSYTDQNLSAKLAYYRIKETDVNGATTFTAIRSVKMDVLPTASAVNISSHQNKVFLQFPKQVNGNLIVRFFSTSGQIVDQQSINNPEGLVTINSKVSGIYIISISNGQSINTAKQVIL